MVEKITRKILTAGIQRFASDAGLSNKEVQLIICTEDDSYATPIYKICHNYQTEGTAIFLIDEKNPDQKYIYDGNKDIFNAFEKGALSLFELKTPLARAVEQAMAKILLRLAVQHKVNPSAIQVMIYSRDVQAGNLLFQLYVTTSDEKGHPQKHDRGEITQVMLTALMKE